MAHEGFHEIQLSGKHLVALFMAGTVIAVVIFLCGVMVGRDIHRQRVALAQAASETPSDPTAEARVPESSPPPAATASVPAAAGAGQETLSYPDRLASNTAPPESLKPPPAPKVEEPTPAPEPPARAAEPSARPAEASVRGSGRRRRRAQRSRDHRTAPGDEGLSCVRDATFSRNSTRVPRPHREVQGAP
jgi:hypothetical protein